MMNNRSSIDNMVEYLDRILSYLSNRCHPDDFKAFTSICMNEVNSYDIILGRLNSAVNRFMNRWNCLSMGFFYAIHETAMEMQKSSNSLYYRCYHEAFQNILSMGYPSTFRKVPQDREKLKKLMRYWYDIPFFSQSCLDSICEAVYRDTGMDIRPSKIARKPPMPIPQPPPQRPVSPVYQPIKSPSVSPRSPEPQEQDEPSYINNELLSRTNLKTLSAQVDYIYDVYLFAKKINIISTPESIKPKLDVNTIKDQYTFESINKPFTHNDVYFKFLKAYKTPCTSCSIRFSEMEMQNHVNRHESIQTLFSKKELKHDWFRTKDEWTKQTTSENQSQTNSFEIDGKPCVLCNEQTRCTSCGELFEIVKSNDGRDFYKNTVCHNDLIYHSYCYEDEETKE